MLGIIWHTAVDAAIKLRIPISKAIFLNNSADKIFVIRNCLNAMDLLNVLWSRANSDVGGVVTVGVTVGVLAACVLRLLCNRLVFFARCVAVGVGVLRSAVFGCVVEVCRGVMYICCVVVY